jgi:hypothetical protein
LLLSSIKKKIIKILLLNVLFNNLLYAWNFYKNVCHRNDNIIFLIGLNAESNPNDKYSYTVISIEKCY